MDYVDILGLLLGRGSLGLGRSVGGCLDKLRIHARYRKAIRTINFDENVISIDLQNMKIFDKLFEINFNLFLENINQNFMIIEAFG